MPACLPKTPRLSASYFHYKCTLALLSTSLRSKVTRGRGGRDEGSVGKKLNSDRTSVTGSHGSPDVQSKSFP